MVPFGWFTLLAILKKYGKENKEDNTTIIALTIAGFVADYIAMILGYFFFASILMPAALVFLSKTGGENDQIYEFAKKYDFEPLGLRWGYKGKILSQNFQIISTSEISPMLDTQELPLVLMTAGEYPPKMYHYSIAFKGRKVLPQNITILVQKKLNQIRSNDKEFVKENLSNIEGINRDFLLKTANGNLELIIRVHLRDQILQLSLTEMESAIELIKSALKKYSTQNMSVT
ncbi:MAG: hypothetical protein NUV67_02090 [archaeon]|nr:hypothetical protein [archaeon]